MKNLVIVFCLYLISVTAYPCTVFTLKRNGKILTGNNEDHRWQDSRIHFVQGKQQGYGYMYFSHASLPGMQGGMNEKGLMLDILSGPYRPTNNKKQKCHIHLLDSILIKCQNIEEVAEILKTKELSIMPWIQLMFADKYGNAMIVEGDSILYKEAAYMISTNFYKSDIEQTDPIDCERYKIASEMLDTAKATINNFRKILAATHVEWSESKTLYSNIYDHEKQLIYLYHFHNYENVYIIDLKQELQKGNRSVSIPSLFPGSFAAMNFEKEHAKVSLQEQLFQLYLDKGVDSLLVRYNFKKQGLAKRKQLYDSLKQVNRAYQLNNRDRINYRTLDWLGRKMMEAERFEDAVETMKFNLELFPTKPELWIHLGESYLKLKDTQAARACFEKILQLDKDNEKAVKYLRAL